MSTGSMILPPPQTREFGERVLELEDECRREYEQTGQSMQEIGLLLNKTNSEIEKLATRELQFSNRVRDMEQHLENYSRTDIRDLYTGSHDVQLRLFMMRSQAEQLQSRQQHLREFQEKLRLLLDLLAIVPIEDAEVAASVPYRTARLGGTMVMGGMTQAIGEGSPSSNGLSILSLIEAQEEERLRISRQIHDGPTQTLSNLILRAEICERLIDRDVAEARLELRGLKSLINASLQDTRRLIFDLRPMTLDDLGLVPTVRRYLVELGRINGGFQGDVEGPEHDTRLSSTIQVALFRFIQSLLHALLVDGTAESLDVTIAVEELSVRILVEAAGLETERAEIEEQLNDSYFRHRLELLQGSLTINPRPHRGMAVELIVNIPGEGALS